MKLRPYQDDAITSIFDYFRNETGNPVVVMPTGTGKSVVIGQFIKRVCLTWPNQRILKLTHVKELIEQNFDKLMQLWPMAPAGIYSAGLNRKEICNITYAGIGSVAKKADQFGHIDLILIDECHRLSVKDSTQYRTFINELLEINPYLKVIGFTATPFRLGQGYITEGDNRLFTDICYDLSSRENFKRLFDEGYLIKPIPVKTNQQIDVSEVRITGGEFNNKDLESVVDRDDITYAALQETLLKAPDRNHILVFATSVKHCQNIVDMLEMLGEHAVMSHSKLSSKENDENIRLFKSGQVRFLVNNNRLTTGFDYPEIDCIVGLRPSMSPGLWVQILGRGTRPVYAEGFDLTTLEGRWQAILTSPKRDCLVLDFAGNTARLGPINDPVIPKPRGKKKGDAPVRICGACGAYNHASAAECEFCGTEFPRKSKLKSEASTVAIVADDNPVVEDIKVDLITYRKHKGRVNKPDTLTVTYQCGLTRFKEYVCVEHDEGSYARRKAEEWWARRLETPLPKTIDEVLEMADSLPKASSIKVWVNKKYPEILNYEF